MYKICSQFLIVLSCVMLMVVSLQVDYVMIACILTGIIVCTFIDMQGVPQMSPAKESKTADRAFDSTDLPLYTAKPVDEILIFLL
jgi:hydrogenase maturation factor